jgi:hypothetical protein
MTGISYRIDGFRWQPTLDGAPRSNGRTRTPDLNLVTAQNSTTVSERTREALRRKYRPDRVRILFIGEAPPASGRFFYREDSGLYRAVRDTFIAAFPSLQKDDFLAQFRASGCYLIDLCGEPVDRLPARARTSICRNGEVRLARTIRSLHPEVVVTLVRSIRTSVERALATAHWSRLHLTLPYPGRWKHHRAEFQRLLIPVLQSALQPLLESGTKLENRYEIRPGQSNRSACLC